MRILCQLSIVTSYAILITEHDYWCQPNGRMYFSGRGDGWVHATDKRTHTFGQTTWSEKYRGRLIVWY